MTTPRIKILSDHVINRIAAGEVVERPASVVKELTENSLDAEASEIIIDIEQAGSRMIRVVDNGSGMSKDDAHVAFERHATSKITTDADLDSIRTMGFRGEALASIASVSQVRLVTAERGTSAGVKIEIDGGTVQKVSEVATLEGTTIEVNHLFFNTPARRKFLKSVATEFSHILTIVSRLAMAHPAVRFKLTHNKKTALDLPPSSGMRDRVFQLYGGEITEQTFEFSGGRENVRLYGLIGRPAYTRADRTYQDFYVNGRAVKNASLTHALYSAYGDMLMHNRHPVGFIFIEIDPALVDVNVHPAKAEVRFRSQSQIHDLVKDAIRECLRAQGMPISATSLSTPREGRIQEAIADYLDGPSRTADVNSARSSQSLFGRRKGDSGAIEPPYLPKGRSKANDVQNQFQPQIGLLAEHGMVPLAQVHDSYIVAQSQDGMAIIDQHAAHERVLFEKLQDQFAGGNVPIQDLLIPAHLELGPAQSSLLEEYVPELQRLGFVVEYFGSGVFMIKAIPFLMVGADYKKLLLDILDEVNVHGRSGKLEELRDGILSTMACHPAIKVHRRLDQKEMETLLDSLFRCRMPHTCPHGRPTVMHFSLGDIQKMFKRV